MAGLWRVLFMATLASAARVDEDPVDSADVGGSNEANTGSGADKAAEEADGEVDSAVKDTYHPQVPCSRLHRGGNEQEAARAAAVGAHAAGVSPSDVVVAAADASRCSSNIQDPSKAKEEAELAAERALGLPKEVSEAGATAYAWAAERKGRTKAELAAADVAKVTEMEAAKRGQGFEAAVAAHHKAMEVEKVDGSGRGYIYDIPLEPTTTPNPDIAKTRGFYAMWNTFRKGGTPGDVVDAAVDAVKRAGGTESDVEDTVAIASDPDTFKSVDKYIDADKAGEAAAADAAKAGWPRKFIAMAAARAAADTQEQNPEQDIEDTLDAGRAAAQYVMDKRDQSPAEVAQEAAKKAKEKAEEYGHTPEKVAQLTARAAAKAAQERGAGPVEVAKLAEAARDTVSLDNSQDWDVQQWNTRVYTETDRNKEDKDDIAQLMRVKTKFKKSPGAGEEKPASASTTA